MLCFFYNFPATALSNIPVLASWSQGSLLQKPRCERCLARDSKNISKCLEESDELTLALLDANARAPGKFIQHAFYCFSTDSFVNALQGIFSSFTHRPI